MVKIKITKTVMILGIIGLLVVGGFIMPIIKNTFTKDVSLVKITNDAFLRTEGICIDREPLQNEIKISTFQTFDECALECRRYVERGGADFCNVK